MWSLDGVSWFSFEAEIRRHRLFPPLLFKGYVKYHHVKKDRPVLSDTAKQIQSPISGTDTS